MSLEFDYLAALTRDYFREGEEPTGPAPSLDWARFLQICSDHHVGGTLLPLVPRGGLSTEVLRQMEESQRRSTESTILRLLFLERILPELANAGCSPIVLKGGVLATDYYRQPEQRYLADLDLLVTDDQVEPTCKALWKLGLRFTETAAHPSYYRDHHFHWIMGNAAGFVVEVHWALTLPESIYSFDLARLRARSRTLPLNNSEMTVPGPADLLLHVVAQCTAGGFGELRRIIDSALIFPKVENLPELAEQAREQNQPTALWLMLLQTQRWTGLKVPEEFLNDLCPGKTTARMLERLAEKMVRHDANFRHRGEFHNLLHWLCAPTPALRKRELRRFLSPDSAHWLELGYAEESPPGLPRRLAARLSRLSTACYLAAAAGKAYFE